MLLIVPFGIEGVAFGTALPNLISNLIVIGYVCHLLEVKKLDYVRVALLPPLLLGLLLGCGWLISIQYAPIDSWLMFLLTGSVGMAIYLPCAALMEFGPRAVGDRLRAWAPTLIRARSVSDGL